MLLFWAMIEDEAPYQRDIETVELMRTIGIDLGEEPGIQVTMAGGAQSQGGESGQEAQKPAVYSCRASTMSKACMEIQTYGSRTVAFSHVTQCVLGEGAARRDLLRLMDFYERNTEMRLNAKLFIVRGGTANELITSGSEGEDTVIRRLETIESDAALQGDTKSWTVKELLVQLSENGCGLVPALQLEESREGDGNQEDQPTIQTAGYAVLRENCLAGYLDGRAARGVNYLENTAGGAVVELQPSGGGEVAVRVLKSSRSWQPVFGENGLEGITVQIQVDGAVGEILGETDLMEQQALQEVERLMAQSVMEDVELALESAQSLGSDFLHIRRQIGILRPDRWSWLEQNWDALFPELDFQVAVEAHIRRSYDINQSLEGRVS